MLYPQRYSVRAGITGIAVLVTATAQAQIQGPSTGSTPYATPAHALVKTYSLFTVDNTGAIPDDVVGGYRMAGTPDGLGAFDQGNGTFTVLMNHEFASTSGAIRAHGSKGAFVSQWTVDKNSLTVINGKDLINTVNLWNGSGYTQMTTAFNRFCSADLARTSAYSFGDLGTTERIFMNGEEAGSEGRAFAHIVTGPAAGVSYELPRLGKFSWENAVANPYAQQKTIVMGTEDSTTDGGVYMYVGTKTDTGNEIVRAGLTNGSLYGIKVGDGAPVAENRLTEFGIGNGSKSFTFASYGDVSGLTGTQLNTLTNTSNQSDFLRPEDGAWDTKSNDVFYFVTTDRYDQVKDGVGSQIGRSRLWKLDFTDITNPELGGQISLLLDGTEQGNMFDNITVDQDGNIVLVEDVGNQAHNGKMWRYNIATDSLTMLAMHDEARVGNIGVSPTAPFNSDEEFSGVIDVTGIMTSSALNKPGDRWYLMVDQEPYTTGITSAQVAGGQLILVQVSAPEPGTIGLVLLGATGAILRRRTK